MKTYRVHYREVNEGYFDIEANSENEAIENFYNDFEHYFEEIDQVNVVAEIVEKQEMWAPSDDRKKTEPEFDPMIFDVDNWF